MNEGTHHSRIVEAADRLEQLRVTLEKKKKHRHEKMVEWAGTPDGMAFTMRRAETSDNDDDREFYREILAQGQSESHREYIDRRLRWPSLNVRGPAHAVPLPEQSKAAEIILDWGLMACYRLAEPESKIKVILLRARESNSRACVRKTVTIDFQEQVRPGKLSFAMIIDGLRSSQRGAVLDAFVAAQLPVQSPSQ